MTKFLIDRMLGQTAKWLRLMGIDAKYAPEVDDEKLLELAKEEDRMMITRDRDLEGKEGVMIVEKAPPEEIIPDILREHEVEIDPFSRCSKCNGEVEEIKKEAVKGEVPERVYDTHDDFWICERCDQIYWKGTHWDKISKKIEKIKDRE